MSFEVKMRERITNLTNTANSIQTLSLWLIHHSKKNVDVILNIWLMEIKGTEKSERLIALVNLANDVIQNSKKKNPDFATKFYDVLQPAFVHFMQHDRENCKKYIGRILSIWRERAMYSDDKLKKLETVLADGGDLTTSSGYQFNTSSSSQERQDGTPPEISSPITSPETSQKVKREFQNFSTVSNELVSILRRLEDPASGDAKIRQLIASYPETIANPALLKKIKTYEECQSLMDKINEATPIVESYCGRLKDELKDRQNTQYLLVDYLKAISEANERTKMLAASVRKRIANLEEEKKEVAKHIESLPDLNVISGSSLPSLSDLFK